MGCGPGDTLLTISDQDSRRVSYLQLFKWNSDFFEQFCILFSYASIARQEATTLGASKEARLLKLNSTPQKPKPTRKERSVFCSHASFAGFHTFFH
jgi:hypothetical protein